MAVSTFDRTKWGTLVDDDGSNTVGTQWNKAKVAEVYDDLDTTLGRLARCMIFNNGTQSITSGAFAALTFNAEDFDDSSMHSTSSNTSRITIPTNMGGDYLVGGATFFAANATGVRQIRITKNGGTQVLTGGLHAGFSVSSVGPIIQCYGMIRLAAADYIELEVNQDSGGPLNVGQAGATHNYLQSQFFATRLL